MLLKAQIEAGRSNGDGRTNIKIHFSKNRVRRNLSTDFYIEPELFDQRAGQVRKFHPNAKAINIELKKLILTYETKLLAVNYETWDTPKIYDYLKGDNGADGRLYPFFAGVIREKAKSSKRNGELYAATLAKIKTFEKNTNFTLKEINPAWLRRLETTLKGEGLKTNSISIHLRILRAIYNEAIDNEIVDITSYPFRRFKIRQAPSEKRALTLDQLRELREMKTERSGVRFAIDTFFLSFYLIGANTGDMYNLTEITGGRAWYKRQKTNRAGGVLSVKIEPEAQRLLNKLSGEKTALCFADVFKSVKVLTTQLNSDLKIAGRKIGAPGLTMYHARHTWATLAATEIEPAATTEEIGRALGHASKGVTDIYIKRNPRRTDAINRAVIDLLK